ncbi:hypothetical protein ACQPZG_16175 [Streptomyces sp. CA-294286]|uniref:hypothetical protein n=1 Tax=Streptomyces sp. CA-294286 TaxID=3240070 RepID=UPI003D89F3A3
MNRDSNGLPNGDGDDRPGRGEQYGPDGPRNDRTGNGRVNDGRNGRDERHGREFPPHGTTGGDRAGDRTPGPGDRTRGPGGPTSGRVGSGRGPLGAGGTGRGPSGSDGTDDGDLLGQDGPALSPDELAVRRLLQGAVADLAPSDGALDHLRRAVPVRRARKRQAVVGAAAAALLIGTAVPAFLHVSQSRDSATARPANAGHAQDSPDPDTDPTGRGPGSDGRGTDGGGTHGGRTPGETTGADPDDEEKESEAGSPDAGKSGTGHASPGEGAYEQDASEPEKPACEGAQLAVVKATTGAPDAQGRVYGTFRIANKSASECAVPGQGRMNFHAMGAADGKRIKVVDHTAGDPAAGLPDPAKEARSLVLPPEAAYEVKFAWVPQDTCPTTGASPDPTPTDGSDDNPGQTTGSTPGGDEPGGGKVPESVDGTDATGTTTQLGTADGDPADGKVAVTHTAEPGAPSAEATIPNACAGTIYRTGVLNTP